MMIVLDGIFRALEAGPGICVNALRGVSFYINEGEFVCITGPSGAGKSTLMNILGCLDQPDRGVYRFAGREVHQLSLDGLTRLRRKAFGFVFQNYSLLGSATARENVELPGVYAGMSADTRRERSEALLAQMDLADRAGHMPGELSGGEQQRVAIARALMNGGHVILADEPTGALDRENGEQVLRALEVLAAWGHTVVIISHNPEIAARAGRRIELRDGRVVTDSGSPPTRTRESAESLAIASKRLARLSRVVATLRECWGALRANLVRRARLRTVMSIMTIMIAVCSGTMILSIGDGIYRETIKSVNTMGLDGIQIIPEDWRPSLPGIGGAESTVSPNLKPVTLGDAIAIEEEVANVRAVSPSILQFPVTASHGEVTAQFPVRGYVDRGAKPGRGPLELRLDAGEYITEHEDEDLERVAVLEAEVRQRLFSPHDNPLGQQILIEGIPFQVKGVFMPRRYQNVQVVDYAIHIPFKTASALLTGSDNVDYLHVFMKDPDRLFETISAIRDVGIRRRGGDTLIFNHIGQEVLVAKKARASLWFLLGAVAGCVLLAGNLSVMNVMLLSVRNRRREIGIRMAVGARRGDILSQFFGEAVTVGLTGAAIGALCALASIPLLEQFGVATELSFLFFVLPIAIALVVSILFGILPARRAAQLNPVTALASD